jgi:hypothetical protein
MDMDLHVERRKQDYRDDRTDRDHPPRP